MQTQDKSTPATHYSEHNQTQKIDNRLDSDTKALILATAIVALSLLLGIYTIGKVKYVQLKNTEQNLNLALRKTELSLIYWKNSNTTNLENIAKVPEFSALIKMQLNLYANGGDLFGNNLGQLRAFFKRNQAIFGDKGFFVIAPDGTNVASLRDNNIGIPNLIMKHRTYQFDNVLNGQPQFIAPIPSDVPISGQKNIKNKSVPASAFFAVPIKDENGKTLGILTQRVNPVAAFSSLHEPSNSIPTMDIYSINANGLIISNSAHSDIFYQRGILNNNESPILSVSALTAKNSSSLKSMDVSSSATGRPISDEVIVQTISGELVTNMRGYINAFNHKVFGIGIWNKELGIGIIVETQQEAALESYFWLKRIIITSISSLIVFVIITTLVWLRSHKKMLRALQKSHDNLDATVKFRTQELHNSHNEARRLLAKLTERNQIIDQHAIVSITDINGTITYANKAFEKISGYTQEELIGKNHRVLNSGKHPTSFWADFYHGIHQRGLWKGNIRNRKKDGSFYWVASTVAALKNSNHETTHFISIRSDITELKEIQIQQDKYKLLLKLATQAAEIGLWTLEFKSGILTWDDQMCNIYEVKPQSFDRSFIDWKNALHPEDAKDTIKKFEDAIQKRTLFDCEFRIHTPQKLIKHLKAVGQVTYDENNIPLQMIGINYDISIFKSETPTNSED